jgi:hypothetical protein
MYLPDSSALNTLGGHILMPQLSLFTRLCQPLYLPTVHCPSNTTLQFTLEQWILLYDSYVKKKSNSLETLHTVLCISITYIYCQLPLYTYWVNTSYAFRPQLGRLQCNRLVSDIRHAGEAGLTQQDEAVHQLQIRNCNKNSNLLFSTEWSEPKVINICSKIISDYNTTVLHRNKLKSTTKVFQLTWM